MTTFEEKAGRTWNIAGVEVRPVMCKDRSKSEDDLAKANICTHFSGDHAASRDGDWQVIVEIPSVRFSIAE